MQKNEPPVTVITITFNLIKNNREVFFRQCLESIHNQTYKNIEHIIIDGASYDGTIDLIKEYSDKSWIKYISEDDAGIYDAMNKGISLANGKYIAFLNSDDFYHDPNAVKKSIEALEKSCTDFSYAPVLMVNEDGTKLHYKHPHCTPKIKKVFFEMPFCHQSMFVKKDVLTAEGMFDTHLKNAGDYDLLLRLCLKKYNCILVEDSFVTFRFGGFSDTNNKQSINEVASSYYKYYNKLCPIEKKECEKIYCRGYANIPSKLASKLKQFIPYFDYGEYLHKIKLIPRIKNNSQFILEKIYSEIKLFYFSPKKFIMKYMRYIFHK